MSASIAMTSNGNGQFQIDVLRSLVAVLLVLGALIGLYLVAPLDAPLTRLEIRGSFEKLQPQDVRRAAEAEIEAGFFAADLEAIHDAVAALPWVARVKVDRKWPGIVALQVWERQAVARWNEKSVLDERSQSFKPRAAEIPTGLPQLAGRAGQETEVLQAWQRLSAALRGTPLELESLKLDERGQWQARTRSDIELRFGQALPDERLPVLQSAGLPALDGRWQLVQYIDLRYTNGFAVGWKDQSQTEGAAQ